SIERFQPNPERVRQMVDQHGAHLFFDTQPQQEFCCAIRKVEPNKRALASAAAWRTGLRKDQSSFRKQVPTATVIEEDGRPILKLCPLVDWSEDQVRAYIDQNDVPSTPLYDQGYTSIGCIICTTPTRPGEAKRAGR